AGERPRRHGGPVGHRLDRERLVEVLEHVLQRGREPVGPRLPRRHRGLHELRLPALPVRTAISNGATPWQMTVATRWRRARREAFGAGRVAIGLILPCGPSMPPPGGPPYQGRPASGPRSR